MERRCAFLRFFTESASLYQSHTYTECSTVLSSQRHLLVPQAREHRLFLPFMRKRSRAVDPEYVWWTEQKMGNRKFPFGPTVNKHASLLTWNCPSLSCQWWTQEQGAATRRMKSSENHLSSLQSRLKVCFETSAIPEFILNLWLPEYKNRALPFCVCWWACLPS